MQPSDSVHHATIRLVSLNFRLRRRIAAVVCTRQLSTSHKCHSERESRNPVSEPHSNVAGCLDCARHDEIKIHKFRVAWKPVCLHSVRAQNSPAPARVLKSYVPSNAKKC